MKSVILIIILGISYTIFARLTNNLENKYERKRNSS